jgi:MFS family permease
VLVAPVFSTKVILAAGWRWFTGVQAIATAILAVTWLLIDRSVHGGSWVRQGSPWLGNRTALGCYAAYIAYTYCTYVTAILVPQLVRQAGVSIANFSVVSDTMYAALGASALLSGWLSDRLIGSSSKRALRVRKRFMFFGLLLAASIGGVGYMRDVTLMFVLAFVSFAGLGVLTPSLWALLQSAAPPGAAARWGGIQGFCGGVAGLIASALTGAIAANGGPAVMLPAAGVCVLTAFAVASLIRTNDPAPRGVGH